MFRKGFWMFRLVGTVILIVVLAVGAYALQRSAWNDGYMMGRLAASGQETPPMLYTPYMGYGRGNSLGLFLCLPLGLLVLGGLMLLPMAFGLHRMRRWRRMMAGNPEMRARFERRREWRHGRHHHMSPRCWDDEEPAAEDKPAPGEGADTEPTPAEK